MTDKIFVEMRILDESSQRELAAYRKLGSIKQLKALKYQEQLRRQRKYKALQFVDKLLGGVLVLTMLMSIVCIMIAFA